MKWSIVLMVLSLLLLPIVGAIDWEGSSESHNDGSTDSSYDEDATGHMVAEKEVLDCIMASYNSTAKNARIISDSEIDIVDDDLVNGDELVADNEDVFDEVTLGNDGLEGLAAQDARYILRARSSDKDTFPVFLQAWQASDFADRVVPLLSEGYPFGIAVEKDISSARGDNWLEYQFSIPVEEDYKNLLVTYKYRLNDEDVVAQISIEEGGQATVYPPQVYTAST